MRERAVRSGRVAQPGLGVVRQKLCPFAPGPADWRRDTDELISAVRVHRDATSSSPFSLSSPANGVGASHASAGLKRGAAAALGPAVTPSLSTRNHAGGTLAPPQVGPGIGEETTGPSGPGPTPALVLCATCRQPIVRNAVLGISFCRIHGLSQAFVFIPRGRGD